MGKMKTKIIKTNKTMISTKKYLFLCFKKIGSITKYFSLRACSLTVRQCSCSYIKNKKNKIAAKQCSTSEYCIN